MQPILFNIKVGHLYIEQDKVQQQKKKTNPQIHHFWYVNSKHTVYIGPNYDVNCKTNKTLAT